MVDRPEDETAPRSPSLGEQGSSIGEESWGSATGDEPEGYDRRRPAYLGDRRFYRIVVWFLGVVAVVAAAGTILLAILTPEVPDALVALGSASIGALAGLIGGGGRQ